MVLPPAESDGGVAGKKDKSSGSSAAAAAKQAAKKAAKKGSTGASPLGLSGSWKPVPKDVAIVGLVLVFLGLRCVPRPRLAASRSLSVTRKFWDPGRLQGLSSWFGAA